MYKKPLEKVDLPFSGLRLDQSLHLSHWPGKKQNKKTIIIRDV